MKNILKITALVMSVLMLSACLFSCGSTTKTVADIQKAGKLVIATSPDFPPFEGLEGDEIVGIEVDIVKIICEKLGVEPEFVQCDFDSVLPGVQAGKYDMGMSGISVTDTRKENTLFTDPYCLAAQAIVVKEGSDITCKADLEGKSVSVQSGTTAEDFCTTNGYAVSSFQANDDAELAMVQGKVDAWVIDDLTAAEMVAIYNAENDEQLVILDDAMTTEPYAFAFKLGNDELVAEINTIVNELVADGTIASIFEAHDAPFTSPAK